MARIVRNSMLLRHSTFIRRLGTPATFSLRYLHASPRCHVKEKTENVEDQPIRFSTSRAANWDALSSFGMPERKHPSYQPYIITASLTVFLIYFLVLREENDLDEELNQSLFQRVPGLEEQQLRAVLKYNLEHNKDTADIENRLKEIIEQKKAAATAAS